MPLQVDVRDPRFQSLFTSEDFALDPTDPQFAKAGGSAVIMAERAKRKAAVHARKAVLQAEPAAARPASRMHGMVSALKHKAKQRPQNALKWRQGS